MAEIESKDGVRQGKLEALFPVIRSYVFYNIQVAMGASLLSVHGAG